MTHRTERLLRRARVELYEEIPYFGYLLNYANFVDGEDMSVSIPDPREDADEDDEIDVGMTTAAIDPQGNIYYNPEFFDKLNDEEIKGVLAHEIMHVAMSGHERQNGRHAKLWNIAQDIIINHLITKAGLQLPEDVNDLIPENGELEFGDAEFEDLDNESFETVYAKIVEANEIPDEDGMDFHIVQKEEDGDGDGQTPVISSDGEEEIGEGDGEGDGEVEGKVQEEDIDWEEASEKAEAANDHAAEQRGENPLGHAAGVVSARGEATVDYERFVKQKISTAIPSDYDMMSPSKRSRATGVYMPKVERQSDDAHVTVVLDTSGSISDEMLQQFAAEMVEIVNPFDRVSLTLIQHDAEVQAVDDMDDAEEGDVEKLEIVGRGGTDHIPVFKHMEDENFDTDLVVSYTDGYSRFPDSPVFNVPHLWVLPRDSTCRPSDFPFGSVSRLDR